MRIPKPIQAPQDDFEGQEPIGGLPRGISAAAAQPSIESADAPATLGSPAPAAASSEVKIARPNSGPRAINVPSASTPLGEQTATDLGHLNQEKNLTPKIWRKPEEGGIQNPILRAMARVGDVASQVLAPRVSQAIPGTEMHHKLEVQGAQGRYNQDLSAADVESQTNERNAQAEHLLTTPQVKTAFEAWQAQNPGVPVEKFFEAQQNAKPDHNPSEFGEWRKQNPQAPLSGWFDLKNSSKPDTAADADNRYRAIEQKLLLKHPVTPEEEAFVKSHEKLKTLGPVTSANLSQPGKNDARADRSYQFNSGQLEKLGQPIDQAMQRMGNLQESLKQGTPQADALIAPELLSIMAGGSGSGLRMNESEIVRIVGARSNWESLKASVNKWKTDPNAANSITEPQRQQIRALVDAVNHKLMAKQAILDSARQQLIESDDPHDHRKIVAETKKQLDAIDAGTAQGGGAQPQRPANVPEGYVFQKDGPKGAGWYKPQGK